MWILEKLFGATRCDIFAFYEIFSFWGKFKREFNFMFKTYLFYYLFISF